MMTDETNGKPERMEIVPEDMYGEDILFCREWRMRLLFEARALQDGKVSPNHANSLAAIARQAAKYLEVGDRAFEQLPFDKTSSPSLPTSTDTKPRTC